MCSGYSLWDTLLGQSTYFTTSKNIYYFFSKGEHAHSPQLLQIMQLVSRIWGDCKAQRIQSATEKPWPWETTFVIMVSPLPGKYVFMPQDNKNKTIN